jgi:hypothetical protein
MMSPLSISKWFVSVPTDMYFVLSVILRIRNVSDKSCSENQNTRFLFNNSPNQPPTPPPRKSCRLWYNVKKYCRTGQATDDNMAHAPCVLDTQGYRKTLRICNIYCFFSATVVTRTHLNASLCVQRRVSQSYQGKPRYIN